MKVASGGMRSGLRAAGIRCEAGLLLAVFLLTALTVPGGAGIACLLEQTEWAKVSEVMDGQSFRTTDGRIVRLASIAAPLEPFASDEEGERLAVAAKKGLASLIEGKTVSLAHGVGTDRYRRLVAHVRLENGGWLQEEMVAVGLARAQPASGDASCLADLVRIEGTAQRNRRGLWQHDRYAPFRADDPSLVAQKGLYVLVEGRIISVGRGNRMNFLNFGRYWRQDFTVMVPAAVAARMADSGMAVESLAERKVRVRGIIEEDDGPLIRLTDAAEVEILGDD